MPVEHEIDDAKQLIITTGSGEVSDELFIEALYHYQKTIRSHPDYQAYNELLDFRHIDASLLTTKGLIEMGKIARFTDKTDIQTKLAIVVNSQLALGLAHMYITYRSLAPGSNKTLKAFQSRDDAVTWLTSDEVTETST